MGYAFLFFLFLVICVLCTLLIIRIGGLNPECLRICIFAAWFVLQIANQEMYAVLHILVPTFLVYKIV
jgi:hypothetical protein